MAQKSIELISDFQATGWKTPRLYERLYELTEQTYEIGSFAQEFLSTFQKSATIFKDALSYVSRDQFRELIQQALAILVRDENENAEDLIHNASLQFPELLRESLSLIFELRINRSCYYAPYPWRGLTTDKISPFEAALLDPETSLDNRVFLFKSLLATRDDTTVKFAVQYACKSELFGEKEIGVRLAGEMESVGFTFRNGAIERYCMNHVRHFTFFKGKFKKVDKAILTRAELDKVLTSHVARHAFATTVTLQNGIPMECVSEYNCRTIESGPPKRSEVAGGRVL